MERLRSDGWKYCLRSSYRPEELENRQILLFANLKPAPLRGILSNGMHFADDTDKEHICVLLSPPEGAKSGVRALFHGIAPAAENRILKLKDFEKIVLDVKNKAVFCGDSALEVNGKAVSCDVPDGSKVH